MLAQSRLSTSNITPLPTTTQIAAISPGYYHTTRTIAIGPMSAGTKATVSSEGAVTTAPSVTIGGDTNMVTANSGTYYFTRTGVANNGTV